MKKRTFALVMIAVMIALTFGVGTCFAASANSTKTVYVISSISFDTYYDDECINTTKFTYKYNDNGLLTSYKDKQGRYGKYKYDGKKLKSSTVYRGSGEAEKCTYNWKDGKITKYKETNSGDIYKFKYNKNGKIREVALIQKDLGDLYYYYKYNSKKHLTKRTLGIGGTEYTYTYDKSGFLKTANLFDTYKYKNTVKNGRATKIVETMPENPSHKRIISVKYKKMQVPSSYAALVRSQRTHILINHGYIVLLEDLPLGSL